MPQRADEQLLADFCAGSIDAFDELYQRYRQPTFGFLVRLLRDRGVAEDVFQQLWLQVIEHAAGFRAGGNVRTWLFTLARSRAYDHLRRDAVRGTSGSELLAQPAHTNGALGNPDDEHAAYSLDDHGRADRFAHRVEWYTTDDDGQVGVEATGPPAARLQAERRQLLDRALAALPDEQRVVFLLREEGELSLAEAAETLGIPYETARSRYRYALARLRTLFSVGVRRLA